MSYGKPRWIQNQEARENERREPIRACDALENFRQCGEARDFPQLQVYLMYGGNLGRREITEELCQSLCRYPRRSFNQTYFGNPGLTLEEYQRFEAAWKATQTDCKSSS